MSKSRDAFKTISEVSDVLDTPAHVLRFWESKFSQVKPVKRAGGRRYYRPGDVELLAGIKQLLHDDGMTIKGAQKLLREQGVKSVVAMGAAQLDNMDVAQPDPEDITPDPVPEPTAAPEAADETLKAAPTPVDTPDLELDITNVVPMAPAPTAGPKLTMDLSAKPAPDAQPDVAKPLDVPADPADADSKAGARLFHLLHKAPHDKIAAQARAIAPLLDRMQVLRDRIELR